jgi:formylmethanofuran dehydrogenase subunit B
MALKFRVRGLAETFVDSILCPGCGVACTDDQYFSTELTKVTFEGIVVVVQCKVCSEIFVPTTQRLGVLDYSALCVAVEKDSIDSRSAILPTLSAVRLNAERLNAERKNSLH